MKKKNILLKILTVLFQPFATAKNIKGGVGVRRETGQQGGWGSGFKDDFRKLGK
jgi:hypothetical protein